MNVSVLILVLLTTCVSFSSINGVRGSPNFNFKKASESAAELETTIQLTIAVKNLFTIPWIAKNLCVTSTRPVDGEAWTEYHSTEIDPWTRNPTFASKVKIPYLLKYNLELKFEIYHELGNNAYKPEPDLLLDGYATYKLADLVRARKVTLPLARQNGETSAIFGMFSIGSVIVYTEILSNKYDEVNLKLMSESTDKSGVCGAPQHYFEIYKRFPVEEEASIDEDDYILVHRTEALKKRKRHTEWETISIPWSSLSGSDDSQDLKFVCKNQNYTVGEFKTTLKELQNYKVDFDLSTQQSTAAGKISIVDFYINNVPSFADFMEAGLRMHLTIAIDFTRRSGLPENPESFHYRGSGQNKCEKAIRLVVNAFKDYVSSNKYDIRGFGARKHDDADVSTVLDDFKLYEDWDGAEGIEGATKAYRTILRDKRIHMGPGMNLAPTISQFASRAAVYTSSSKNYSVLVVLAVGKMVADEETQAAMLRARLHRPVSIIIVSIGDADLTEMKKMYKKDSHTTLRDNFHFMSIYESNLLGDDESSAYRRTELLAKLPEQIVSYMYSKNFKPKTSR